MIPDVKVRTQNPEITANYVSKLFFCWLCPMARMKDTRGGYEHTEISSYDDAETLGNRVETWWESETLKSKTNPSLIWSLVKTFYASSIYYGILILIQCIVLTLAPPVFSRHLIFYFKYQQYLPSKKGLTYAGLIVGCKLFNVLFFHHTLLQSQRMGHRSKIACSSIIYRKIFKLNILVIRQLSVKDILQLLIYETEILESAAIYVHYLWVVPLQLFCAGFLLYDIGGFSALMGLLFFVVVAIPLHCLIAIKYQSNRELCHEYMRKRCLHLSEMVSNMKVVKTYCYEKYFYDTIMEYRSKEFQLVQKSLYLQATQIFVTYLSSKVAFFITLTIAIYYHKTGLDSEWVYPVMQIFDALQLYAAIRFPCAVARFCQLRHSIEKIKAFLMLPVNTKLHAEIPRKGTKMGYANISDVTADWNIENQFSITSKHTLKDINLEITPGSLYIVIGAKGSGKSSLLNLLINEIPIIRGKVQKIGRLSYSSQEPWLFTSSIKQNIMFGEAPFISHYKEVIRVCGVSDDLKDYPHGDKTIIGEQIIPDDAQKAKINLARSVYRDADIYVFDEPFAALDPPLAKYIFDECILTHLANKTRILATKHSSFLKDADLIVIIEDGSIKAVGTLNELPEDVFPVMKTFSMAANKQKGSDTSLVSRNTEEESYHELRNTFSKKSLYKRYIYNFITANQVIFLAIFTTLCQLGVTTTAIWLMHWMYKEDTCFTSTSVFKTKFSGETLNITRKKRQLILYPLEIPKQVTRCKEERNLTLNYYLIGTSVFAVTVVFSLIKLYYLCQQHNKATKALHDNVLQNIIRARIDFFKSKIIEAITDHFSDDLFAVDERICRQLLESLQIASLIAGMILFICCMFPCMIVISIFFLVILYFIRKAYMRAGKFYYNCWIKERMPLISHINATLGGLKTIRCYNANYLISREFDELLNYRTSPHITLIFLDHMFGFYAEILSVVYVGIIIFQSFFVPSYFYTSGSAVGMCVTEAYTLIVYIQNSLKQTIKFSYSIRSKNYLENYKNIDVETEFIKKRDNYYVNEWPTDGEIEFDNIYMRIVEHIHIEELYNFSLKISSGDRVAIVGKPGSGRGCIVSALFNFASFTGNLHINGINIQEIGLALLRSNITLISTTGFVYTATVSENLDPYDFYGEDILGWALEKVNLKNVFPLDKEINEGMITIEQKFLISLARALISHAKIVVKEETSSILEPSTRYLINEIMETEFEDKTVIFVTNKREEIVLTNNTVVLEDGKIVEYDTTDTLLKNEKSKLNMVLDVKKLSGSPKSDYLI